MAVRFSHLMGTRCKVILPLLLEYDKHSGTNQMSRLRQSWCKAIEFRNEPCARSDELFLNIWNETTGKLMLIQWPLHVLITIQTTTKCVFLLILIKRITKMLFKRIKCLQCYTLSKRCSHILLLYIGHPVKPSSELSGIIKDRPYSQFFPEY